MCPQNAGNAVSKTQNSKHFRGSMPPDPPTIVSSPSLKSWLRYCLYLIIPWKTNPNCPSPKSRTYSIFSREISISFSGSYISATLADNNEIFDGTRLILPCIVDIFRSSISNSVPFSPLFSLLRRNFKVTITMVAMMTRNIAPPTDVQRMSFFVEEGCGVLEL